MKQHEDRGPNPLPQQPRNRSLLEWLDDLSLLVKTRICLHPLSRLWFQTIWTFKTQSSAWTLRSESCKSTAGYTPYASVGAAGGEAHRMPAKGLRLRVRRSIV